MLIVFVNLYIFVFKTGKALPIRAFCWEWRAL